jgi:DNA-binding response OmpR family regulator
MPRSRIDKSLVTPCRILAVHDDIAFQSDLWRVAAASGHVVTALTGGDKAIEMARRLKPDIILLNLGLAGPSGRDGRDLLVALKADPTTLFIPVLAYRRTHEAFNRWHALELGAEDLLSDPLDARAVIAKMERIVLRTSSGKFPTSDG